MDSSGELRGGLNEDHSPPESEAPSTSAGNEPKRSKICSVCSCESETYHLNYGASTCFSCRAFFRRTVQKQCYSQWSCKNGGSCEITKKTRRKCQKCRFDNCLRAGMKAEYILKEDEKKVRFRKLIKKQAKEDLKDRTGPPNKGPQAGGPDTENAADQPEPAEVKITFKRRKKANEEPHSKEPSRKAPRRATASDAWRRADDTPTTSPNADPTQANYYSEGQSDLREPRSVFFVQQAQSFPSNVGRHDSNSNSSCDSSFASTPSSFPYAGTSAGVSPVGPTPAGQMQPISLRARPSSWQQQQQQGNSRVFSAMNYVNHQLKAEEPQSASSNAWEMVSSATTSPSAPTSVPEIKLEEVTMASDIVEELSLIKTPETFQTPESPQLQNFGPPSTGKLSRISSKYQQLLAECDFGPQGSEHATATGGACQYSNGVASKGVRWQNGLTSGGKLSEASAYSECSKWSTSATPSEVKLDELSIPNNCHSTNGTPYCSPTAVKRAVDPAWNDAEAILQEDNIDLLEYAKEGKLSTGKRGVAISDECKQVNGNSLSEADNNLGACHFDLASKGAGIKSKLEVHKCYSGQPSGGESMANDIGFNGCHFDRPSGEKSIGKNMQLNGSQFDAPSGGKRINECHSDRQNCGKSMGKAMPLNEGQFDRSNHGGKSLELNECPLDRPSCGQSIGKTIQLNECHFDLPSQGRSTGKKIPFEDCYVDQPADALPLDSDLGGCYFDRPSAGKFVGGKCSTGGTAGPTGKDMQLDECHFDRAAGGKLAVKNSSFNECPFDRPTGGKTANKGSSQLTECHIDTPSGKKDPLGECFFDRPSQGKCGGGKNLQLNDYHFDTGSNSKRDDMSLDDCYFDKPNGSRNASFNDCPFDRPAIASSDPSLGECHFDRPKTTAESAKQAKPSPPDYSLTCGPRMGRKGGKFIGDVFFDADVGGSPCMDIARLLKDPDADTSSSVSDAFSPCPSSAKSSDEKVGWNNPPAPKEAHEHAHHLTQEEIRARMRREFEQSARTESVYTSYVKDEVPSASFNKNTNSGRFRKRMLKYLDNIRRAYSIACKRMESNPEFILALLALHGQGPNKDNGKLLTKTLLKTHIISLSKLFRDYAVQQPEFLSLSVGDQRKLLLRNTSIFVQYLLARYFLGSTGNEQIHYLLANNIPKSIPKEWITGAQRVTFEEFNEQVRLFPDGFTNMYKQYADTIAQPVIKLRCNFIIGLCCLFQADYASVGFFDEPTQIDGNLGDVFAFSDWANEVFHCANKAVLINLLKSITEVSQRFDQFVSWEDDGDGISINAKQNEIALSYADEEDKWLYSKFDLLHEFYHKIPLGEDVIKEYVMFSYDVPLSKEMPAQVADVFTARMKELLLGTQEFHSLNAQDQSTMMKFNLLDALSLCIVKLDSYTDGKFQLRFALGYLDDNVYVKNYQPVIKGNHLKVISMMQLVESSGLWRKDQVETFRALAASIFEHVRNMERFKLLLFAVLFSNDSVQHPAIRALQQRYVRCLSARMDGKTTGEQIVQEVTLIVRKMTSILREVIAKRREERRKKMAANGENLPDRSGVAAARPAADSASA